MNRALNSMAPRLMLVEPEIHALQLVTLRLLLVKNAGRANRNMDGSIFVGKRSSGE